jgi:hypothetical protein
MVFASATVFLSLLMPLPWLAKQLLWPCPSGLLMVV